MCRWFSVLLLTTALQTAPAQEVDPEIQALVERFFAAQQAEDVEAYLALWSSAAARPSAEQLQFVFNSGDDTFSSIAVVRATVSGATARVRVSAIRARTDLRAKNPDGSARTFTTRLQLALSLVREEDDWKIVREGAPSDELAAALIETSDPAARQSLMQAEPDLLNLRLVEAISRRADGLAQRAQYRAAQEIYERSLEVAQAAGDRKSEGQALQNIANSLYFQRAFAAAREAYERRLTLERAASNDDGIASALVGVATILYSTYEYGAALSAYREALEIQERLNDFSTIGTTLISTGNVLFLQGDYEGAIVDYRRAESLKRKYFDLAGAASALEGLGRVYSAQGNYAAALAAFAGVLDERRKMNDGPRQALVLQSIGETHFRLGNTDAARAAFQESRQLFEKFKEPASAGRSLQGAAMTELLAGRFPAGEKAYTESASLCTAGADPECVARAQVGLAFALAAQKKFDDAIMWYGRSLVLFSELKLEEAGARARIGLAEALAGRGEHDKALEQAVTARRTAVVLENDDVLWRALVSVARAERRLARPQAALGSARAAVAAVERMAAAALERPGRAAPRDSVAAYAALAVLQAEQGHPDAAFATAESLRAHALRAALAANERDIARGMSEEDRAEEHALTTGLTTLLAQRESGRNLPKPDKAHLERLSRAITDAAAQRAAAQQRLFERLPDLRLWRGLGGPASMEDLAALLGIDGASLLHFVVDEYDVVVLTAGLTEGPDGSIVEVTAHTVPIERQALAERIAAALDSTSLAGVEAWRVASKDLFTILPVGVRERLATATSVIIVPDDILWRVPFEALPIGDRYLADRALVRYATSVAAMVTAPPPAAGAELATPVVAVTAPLIPPSVVESLKATAPTWTLRLSDAASEEVAGIASPPDAAKPVVLSGPDATKDNLKAALASAGALHIAAPFRLNSASPLFSPVLLAASPIEAELVPAPATELEAREVFNLASSADVVMISDPSALSMRDAAAAITPLQWAWRTAGATTMIVRRWGGSNELSNQIVAAFYQRLAAGEPPAAAFDAARAAIRETEVGRAPAAWAGWIVIGGPLKGRITGR